MVLIRECKFPLFQANSSQFFMALSRGVQKKVFDQALDLPVFQQGAVMAIQGTDRVINRSWDKGGQQTLFHQWKKNIAFDADHQGFGPYPSQCLFYTAAIPAEV